MDDWSLQGDVGVLELPAKIVGLRSVDGRTLAELIDGRTIDLTDWFTEGAKPN